MANIRNMNQQNPFWNWISQFESSGVGHPFAQAYNPESHDNRASPPEYAPPPPHHEGESPSSGPEAPHPPPDPAHHSGPHHHDPFGPDFPFGSRRGGPHHHGGPHGHHRGGRGGGWGGRCGGGAFGGWPMGAGNGNFDMSKLQEFISQFIPEDVLAGAREGSSGNDNDNNDATSFTPPADIFDTEDAFVVHVALPGAKKEDVAVSWDADKSELNVAGVRHRPGDEEFLKTLVLAERKVGLFERKVRLGSKASPAQVDADAISARMEDGILMVTIPKLDRDIVEVKKIDIE